MYKEDKSIFERRKRNFRYKIKKELLELLGNKCCLCGSCENLEFDHIDKSTKLFAISDGIASKSKQEIYKEANKCQLLCHSCHVKKTKNNIENGKISDDDVVNIILLYNNEKMSQSNIAKIYGLSQSYVSAIIRGKRRPVSS